MIEEKVSIIMPIYNSEKYVGEAIESVLKQTYKNFELILVDDGSRDNSYNIINDYSKKDDRIKVYKKENGGISSTRNFGILKATGKYIAFIDNDDEYKENLLSDNIVLLEKYDADIVKFNKTKVSIGDKNKSYTTSKTDFSIEFLEDNEIWKNFDKINKFGGTIWNAIYKRSFLEENSIKFDETSRNVIEDHEFNLECYKYVKKMVINPQSYYLWNMRTEHSTTGKFIEERFENIKIEGNKLYLFLEEKQIDTHIPGFWAKVKISYLINILLVMNYKNSGFNYRKFTKYLKDLKKYELFKRKCIRTDYRYLKKKETFFRKITIKLFDLKMYGILFFSSKIKFYYEIKNGRRF